jgi:uncharacterized protein YkwD
LLRIGPVSLMLFGSMVSTCFAMLLPSAAQAACAQWALPSSWIAMQSNGSKPEFSLQQTETLLQGKARYSYVHKDKCNIVACGDDIYFVDGSVDGTITGDSLDVTVYWDDGGVGGYTGRIGPTGRMTGTTVDKNNPSNVATWYSDQPFKCLTSAAPPVAVTPPGPVKKLGRVTTGQPTGAPLPVCEAARVARARNNAAAPALEVQCKAATAQHDAALAQEVEAAPDNGAGASAHVLKGDAGNTGNAARPTKPDDPVADPGFGDAGVSEAAEISEYRRANGVGPVTADPALMQIAIDHSSGMAAARKLTHVLPGEGSFAQRQAAGNFKAENILLGESPILTGVVAEWSKTPNQNAHLLLPGATRIGIASFHGSDNTKHYWTLVLGE